MKAKQAYPVALATFILWALIWIVNYTGGPAGEYLSGDNINPVTFLSGMAFFLSFGFGLPAWLSVLLTVLLLAFIWWSLYRILKKICHS